MRRFHRIKPILTGAAAIFLLATPSVAQAPAAIAGVQSGNWELRDLGRSGSRSQICVRNPARLLQIRHPGQNCPRRVLSEDGRSVTVRYECSGSGWGRTSVTVETPRLVRIQTQGIDGGSPFNASYEARRTGACS